MCIAVSGKLIEIDGHIGKADIRGNILPVELGIVRANVGDYVLIHAGCAISVLNKSEAEELGDIIKTVAAYENN